MADLTYDELARVLKYEPETGRLFWLPRPREMFPNAHLCRLWNDKWAGKQALNYVDAYGYFRGSIFGMSCLAHRVCWALGSGAWPIDQIDHIDGDRQNNRFTNLREVDQSLSSMNCAMRSDNTSGFTGVRLREKTQRWLVEMCGKYIGSFATLEEAVEARNAAAEGRGFTRRHGLSSKDFAQ